MSENTEIVKLATEAFEKLSSSMFDEIAGAVGKFSLLAEKGTVIFLQAIGASLIVMAIIIAWRSNSIFEHIVLELSDRATHQRNAIEAYPPTSEPYTPRNGPPTSAGASHASEVRLPFGAPQFIVLVTGGVVLVCLGSLIDLMVYKWRLDTYRTAQAYDQESMRLKVSLRQSGIQALAETNKVVGNVATDSLGEQRLTPGEMPNFKPEKTH